MHSCRGSQLVLLTRNVPYKLKMINYCIIGLLFYYVTNHVYPYEPLFIEVWVRFHFTLCSFVFQGYVTLNVTGEFVSYCIV